MAASLSDLDSGKRPIIHLVQSIKVGLMNVVMIWALPQKRGRALRSNLFVRSSQKGFTLQSLTQKFPSRVPIFIPNPKVAFDSERLIIVNIVNLKEISNVFRSSQPTC